jgi:hypothetical protein
VGVQKLSPACISPVFGARTEFTHPTGLGRLANANALVSFTFNAGMDQPRAVDGDEIEGELLSEVDS